MGFNKRTVLIFAAILFCFTTTSWAVDPASSGSTFLRIPVGARASALGEAFSPLANDVSAAYWNPAGLTQLHRNQISATHSEWFQGLRHDFLGYSMPWGEKNSIAVSLSAFYANDFEKRVASTVEPAGEFSSTQGCMGLSYSRKITNALRGGITVKGIYESIDEESAFGGAADIGFLYHIKNTGIQIAVAARHLGPGMTFIDETNDLPMTFTGGFAWRLFGNNITAMAQAEKVMNLDPSFAFGLEAQPATMLSTRIGYNYTSDRENHDGISGFTAGLGFHTGDFTIDYAFVPYGDLGDTHRFGITFDFAPSAQPKTPPKVEPKPKKTMEETPPTLAALTKAPETEQQDYDFPRNRKAPAPPSRMEVPARSIEIAFTEETPTPPTPTEAEQIEFADLTQIEMDSTKAMDTAEVVIPEEERKTLTPKELAKKHYDIGVSYHRNKNYEKAKEHYRKAIEYDPYFAPPHANLGMIYIHEGNMEKGRIELRKAREFEEAH